MICEKCGCNNALFRYRLKYTWLCIDCYESFKKTDKPMAFFLNELVKSSEESKN